MRLWRKMKNKLKKQDGTKKYQRPELEVIEFDTEDVIVTSGKNTCGSNVGVGYNITGPGFGPDDGR